MPFLAPGDLAERGLPEEGVTLCRTRWCTRSRCCEPRSCRASSRRSPTTSRIESLDVRSSRSATSSFRRPRTAAARRTRAPRVALAGRKRRPRWPCSTCSIKRSRCPTCSCDGHASRACIPTRSAEIVIAGKVRGHVGEVDPAVLAPMASTGGSPGSSSTSVPSSTARTARASTAGQQVSVAATSISRSKSPNDPRASVPGRCARAAGPARSVELFDVYRGDGVADGSRSLAYRLRFQADDRTLTDAEVATVRAACIETVQKAAEGRDAARVSAASVPGDAPAVALPVGLTQRLAQQLSHRALR